MRLSSVAVLAAASLAASTAASAAPRSETIVLHARQGSGEHGTATLTQRGPDLLVVIAVAGFPANGTPQAAHLHTGTCEHLGTKRPYELNPVVNGRSTTTLRNVDLGALGRAGDSISIHKLLANVSLHVACGGPIRPL